MSHEIRYCSVDDDRDVEKDDKRMIDNRKVLTVAADVVYGKNNHFVGRPAALQTTSQVCIRQLHSTSFIVQPLSLVCSCCSSEPQLKIKDHLTLVLMIV